MVGSVSLLICMVEDATEHKQSIDKLQKQSIKIFKWLKPLSVVNICFIIQKQLIIFYLTEDNTYFIVYWKKGPCDKNLPCSVGDSYLRLLGLFFIK